MHCTRSGAGRHITLGLSALSLIFNPAWLSLMADPGTGRATARRWGLSPAGALVLVLLGATLPAAGCGNVQVDFGSDRPVETREDTFVVGDSPTLVVDNFNGRVTFQADLDGAIRVQARLEGADRIDYEAVQSGDAVTVRATGKGSTFGRSPTVDIDVTGPESTRVELLTGNGRIELRGTRGSATLLRTSNGRVVVENVVGNVHARTTNGAIEVMGLSGAA